MSLLTVLHIYDNDIQHLSQHPPYFTLYNNPAYISISPRLQIPIPFFHSFLFYFIFMPLKPSPTLVICVKKKDGGAQASFILLASIAD